MKTLNGHFFHSYHLSLPLKPESMWEGIKNTVPDDPQTTNSNIMLW